MELKYRLLDHPFYQAWTKGEITKEQLSKYHASYREFIKEMPNYWQKIIDGFEDNSTFGARVVSDEKEHIGLWEQWQSKLPTTDGFPSMDDINSELQQMNTSELLGAIQAFETQQPEVAITKKEGLKEHYGYEDAELIYFDDHMEEEAHIAFGKSLAKRYANDSDYKKGFEKGSELFYKGLDKFLN
ncbi:hypothetical protein OAQ99_01920 [Candidatus Kapabacteria bacterium]|nr:hypothetical protein [Candidatus Kapabacteria bacterium]